MMTSIIVLLIPAVTWAAVSKRISRRPVSSSPLQIYVLNQELTRQQVGSYFPGADIYSPAESESLRRAVVLPVERQTEFFRQAGLAAATKGLSHFDRDMLVRRLRYSDAKKVHDNFKAVSVADARRAQGILRQFSLR